MGTSYTPTISYNPTDSYIPGGSYIPTIHFPDRLRIGLRAYWRFEEVSWSGISNEVQDSSGNGNHAKAYNGVNTVASGRVDRCGYWDEVDDYVRSEATNASLNLWGLDVTVAAWIKLPALPSAWKSVFSYGRSQYSWLTLYVSDINTVHFRVYQSWFNGVTPITVDTWALIWGRYSESSKRAEAYLNLSLDAVKDPASWGPSKAADSYFAIGAQDYTPTTENFYGYIDEVAIWTEYMPVSLMTDFYNLGYGRHIRMDA